VTARKDDAPAADQAAMSNVAGWCSISVGGGDVTPFIGPGVMSVVGYAAAA